MKYPKNELFERLASIEHTRWADWQNYVFEKCERHFDISKDKKTGELVARETGGLIIPEWAVKNWARQIQTSYKDLTEKEKDGDRAQVMRYYFIIKSFCEKKKTTF